jgi:hypothetical protein
MFSLTYIEKIIPKCVHVRKNNANQHLNGKNNTTQDLDGLLGRVS